MTGRFARLCVGIAALTGLFGLAGAAQAQQKSEISITRQPGIFYMPTYIMEKDKLVEKQAEKLGLPNLKVNWVAFSGGGAATDALLSGGVDVLNTGVGNLLLLWDRTKGGVKGIIGTSAQPVTLITRDPKIRSLKDYGPTDKIAVPTVRVSTQAILLQIAAAKLFGPDQWSKLDANTVQLGHSDAAAAMANPTHEVKSHFAAPPFTFYEMKTLEDPYVVADSADIIPGGISQAQLFTTTKFADANPKAVLAIKAAALEAIDLLVNNTEKAVSMYREASGDKTPLPDLLAMLKQPGMMNFDPTPHGTMVFAAHLHKIGTIKTMPTSWKDYYLPTAHDRNGS